MKSVSVSIKIHNSKSIIKARHDTFKGKSHWDIILSVHSNNRMNQFGRPCASYMKLQAGLECEFKLCSDFS